MLRPKQSPKKYWISYLGGVGCLRVVFCSSTLALGFALGAWLLVREVLVFNVFWLTLPA